MLHQWFRTTPPPREMQNCRPLLLADCCRDSHDGNGLALGCSWGGLEAVPGWKSFHLVCLFEWSWSGLVEWSGRGRPSNSSGVKHGLRMLLKTRFSSG